MRKTPRIGIDALGIDQVGGARSVTIPLLQQVFQMKPEWQFFCYLSAYEEELDFPNVNQIILSLSKGLPSRLIFQLIIPFLSLIHSINLIHFIKSQPGLVFSSKKILTIYDSTIQKYPEYFSWSSRTFWKYLQPWYCRKMDQIITISQNAKAEIVQYLKVPAEKVSVIYPATQFNTESLEKFSTVTIGDHRDVPDKPYLLYIGQIGKKKNLITLVKAYKIIKAKKPDFPKLIMVGPRYLQSDASGIFDIIQSSDLESEILYLGPVDREILYHILINSEMLLFPSIHEGFGIPLVEAMEVGVPVISSNISAMPEVLNDAGYLIDDYLSPEAWADAIVDLNEDHHKKNFLVEKGLERAKMFSWAKSASLLVNIYQDLL